MKEKTEKQPKPKKEKQERTPREATALMLGLVALGLAVVGVASLLWLSTLVAAILGGIAVLTGFASLMVGKSGTLPAIVAAVAGFLTVLSSASVSVQSLHETSDSIENSASSVNIKFCFIAVSCYKICNPTIHGFP